MENPMVNYSEIIEWLEKVSCLLPKERLKELQLSHGWESAKHILENSLQAAWED